MKRKLYILTLIALCCLTGIHAQKGHFSKEEFRSRQQAFITEKAGLNAQEAARFFPLYFELQDKKQEQNKEAWQKMRKGKDPNTTETEYAKIVEDVIKARIATDQLELEYVQKYKKFLSAKKIYQVQKAEMKFHRELLKGQPRKQNNRNSMQESCHSPVIRGMTGFLLESYPSFFRNLSFSFFLKPLFSYLNSLS